MAGDGDSTDDAQLIRAEARSRLEAERQEFERRADEQLAQIEQEAKDIRDEARRRAVEEHLRDRFGRTLSVLHDPNLFAELMIQANLHRVKKEVRINPTGSTTVVTEVKVPTLLGAAANARWLSLLFEGNIGQTLSDWTTASEVLRSGLRASMIDISELRSGQFKVALAAS